MQIYIDTETEQQLNESAVKKRLAAPIEDRKTEMVPQPPVTDDEGNSTPRPDRPVERVRSITRTFASLEVVSDEDLAGVNVERIEFIETPKPDVEPWQSVEAGPIDKSTPGEWRATWVVIDPSLEDAKALAKARLDFDFDASLQPVSHDGKLWVPGHSSAAVIDDVVRMTEYAGGTEVTLTDASNAEHTYTLAAARGVSAAVGVSYQAQFLLRAAKRREIDAATTVTGAMSVTWQ